MFYRLNSKMVIPFRVAISYPLKHLHEHSCCLKPEIVVCTGCRAIKQAFISLFLINLSVDVLACFSVLDFCLMKYLCRGVSMQTQNSSFSFQRCEDEPIHIPETIQSYGFLIAFGKETLDVSIVSENIKNLFADSIISKAFLSC